LEALGGGSFEEVVRPPLGNCSLNTQNGLAPAGYLAAPDSGHEAGCGVSRTIGFGSENSGQ
jgi:hypothetical protein